MSAKSAVETDYNPMTMSKMVALNRFSKDKSFEENMDDFYDIFISEDGSELFACKFDACPNVEKQESDIIEHLRQHFSEVPSNAIDINLSDNSGESLKKCKQEFDSDVECIDISDDDTIESESELKDIWNNTSMTALETNSVEPTTNDWEQWVGRGLTNGKQVFYCKYSDECQFTTNLRMKIKTHINKHFETKVSPKTEFNQYEYEYWDQCLSHVFNNQTAAESQSTVPLDESTPYSRGASKNNSKSKSKSGAKPPTKRGLSDGVRPPNNSFNDNFVETPTEVPDTSGLIDINFNHNNTILSLKGMASVKKLEKYIQCQVINGLKYFCCIYGIANGKCDFKSRRSQETANHVHCAHLGFFLECVRPDCDKIFRTPGSWREHQKNHICNFGLYGYQRGVTGKCRNSYLLQYQDKVIVEGNHKAYKCKWKGCGFVTRQRTACKRHIHNSHVCPFRRNKQWKKELLKYMELKSHMTDKPIPIDINNERIFFCSLPQCNAELANETDLRRHETQFCKYKNTSNKLVKNSQNGHTVASKDSQKPKAVAKLVFSSPIPSTSGLNVPQSRGEDSNKKKTLETNAPIVENGHKVDDQKVSTNMQTNGQNVIDADRLKCEKYIERKFYDGINFILCTAPNCKYTTKDDDKIYDHIKRSHSLAPTRVCAQSVADIRQLRKRSQSSIDSNETIISKISKSSTISSHQSSTVCIPKAKEKTTQNALQKIPQSSAQSSSEISPKKTQKLSTNLPEKSINSNLKNKFKGYYKIKRIESEPFYFCEYPSSQCRFYSKTEKELFDHISQTHIVFRCDISNCKRQFKTEGLLEVHKRNHICGFGILGMKATGVCALENVRKYRREILVNGRYRYECKVCKYQSDTKSTVLSHAHNRHIHPQPPPQ